MKLAFLDTPEQLRKAYSSPRNARLWTANWIAIWLALAASAWFIPQVAGPLLPIVGITYLVQLAGYYSVNLVRYWHFHCQGLIYTTSDEEEKARKMALYHQMWPIERPAESVEEAGELIESAA